MSSRNRFRLVNYVACGLFLLAFVGVFAGYPLIGALSAVAALGTYLYCVQTTRCSRCATRLLIKSKGPFVMHVPFPEECPACGLSTKIDLRKVENKVENKGDAPL
jgi:hypothetical protein